jgi:c-di-GMP-binding flagellar brake protein YcgR
MPRLCERRRHERIAVSCPVTIRDKAGRILLRGRTADVSLGGIRILGKGGEHIEEGQPVWVELAVPTSRGTHQRPRIVKVSGEVRRVEIMGEWRSVIVVVFETDFSTDLLDPML